MKTEPLEQVLEFGARRIVYHLHRDNRRTLRVTVSPRLTVDVHVPRQAEDEHVRRLLRKKAPWIARTLDKMEAYQPLPSPKRYVSGETFVYLGRQYRLRVSEGRKMPARLHGQFLVVQVPDKHSTPVVRHVVEDWYTARASEIFKRHAERCAIIAQRHGISEPRFAIRRMQVRWGSCSRNGLITLNVHLVKAPVHCIQYVIMHELCHLEHHNHSKAFYSLLSRCMPDWQSRKKALGRIVLES